MKTAMDKRFLSPVARAPVRSQRRNHNETFDKPSGRMTESQRQSWDNFIAEALPELCSWFVRAEGEIELHGRSLSEPPVPWSAAYCPRNTATASVSCRHIPAITHMGATSPLVRAKEIGADDIAIFFSSEDLTADCKPYLSAE